MILATIIWFVLVLSFLVIIHEIGHFLAAKWMGVHVEEFGLGYPPRVRKLFTRWNTLFSLNALPLGGFVKLYGDDAENLPERVVIPGVSESMGFAIQKPWRRLVIILAGVFINFVFGVIAFAGLYSAIGIPTPLNGVMVSEVSSGSPAEGVGLASGDFVLRLTEDGNALVPRTSEEFITAIGKNKGKTVELAVRRNGEEKTFVPRVRTDEEIGPNQGALGVSVQDTEFRFYPWWQMPFRGIWIGLQDSYDLGRSVLIALQTMIVDGLVRGRLPQELSGPVGIVDQAVQMDILKQGPLGTLNFAALLSVNLAIMNLLPIPALDGGRAVFVLLERVVGKKRRVAWEQQANAVGFVFLLGLIFLITIQDVVKIIRR